MNKIDLASPVVKWVGGKRQLLERLMPLFPESYTTYCEPFIGGGAVLFALQPKSLRIQKNAFMMCEVGTVMQNFIIS